MSLQDLAGLAGIPALEPAVAGLFKLYESIENVKIYKDQCKRLHGRCVELLLALRHNDESFFGSNYQAAIDQADHNIQSITEKVFAWSKLGSAKSWTRQSEIKQGLEEMNRDLVQCATRLNILSQMESFRKATEIGKVMDQRHAEIEEKLQRLLERTKDIGQFLTRPETEIADDMLSIQQAIHEDTAGPEDLQGLQERLLNILHRSTERLPPLIDLTGEVRRISDDPDISGGFSDVYLGEWLGNEKVALKLTRGINQTPKAEQRFKKEVEIWRKLQHQNVERLYGVATLGSHIYTVSPWMEHRDALLYIKNNPQADRLKILVEVATGLEFLHRNRVVHGDVRAANILISNAGIACITDFGLSLILEEEATDSSSNSTLDSSGNSRWMAPELINPELIGQQAMKRNPATDIWSYGMLCLEILTGQRPFPNRPHGPAVISDLMTGVRPTRPSVEATSHGLSDSVWELMQTCWQQKPQLRPAMAKIVSQMQTFQAERVGNPFTLRSQSPLALISEDSKASDMVVTSESPLSTTPPRDSQYVSTPTANPTGPTSARKPSVRSIASAINSFTRHPRIPIPDFTPRPSTRVPNTSHPKSASIDIVPSRVGKLPKVSTRPSTAPQNANSDPPRLPALGEIHSEISGEGLADFLVYLQHEFSDSIEMPIVRVEGPSTTEEPAISTSLPTSFAFPAEQTLRRPALDIAPSEGSGMTSTGSEFSPTSSGSVEPPVNRPVYIKYREGGIVEAANLPGLVERLILDSKDLRMDIRFRETFLTSYQAFTDAETVFSLLLEKFEASSSPTHTAEQRTRVRYSVISVLDLWLRGHHVGSKDVPLLYRMRQFALSIQHPTAAPTFKGSASKLTELIDQTLNTLVRPVPSPTSTSSSSVRSVAMPTGMTPAAFAAALTELESKRFKKIMPSDCIGYLKGIRDLNGVYDFIVENDKVSYFVQHRILTPDDQFQRSQNLKYFLCVAEECRKLRNFSTTCALIAGLASSSIAGLKRTSTLDGETRRLFQDIENLISQDNNFRAYRRALNSSQEPCIPSLRVHLHDLKAIHEKHRTFIKDDGHNDAINFDLFQRLYERIRHILSYQDPPPKPLIGLYRLEIPAFIESQLRALVIDEAFHGRLQERASRLAQEEQANFTGYLDELRAAGFIP